MAFPVPVVIHSTHVIRPKTELVIPVVSGGPSTTADSKINSDIRHQVSQMVAYQGSLSDPRSQMQGWYETKTNEKGVLSLSLFNYAYTGGAHGLTLQHSFTFTIADGRSYKLAELFKPGSNYVARLSKIIQKQIKDRQIETLEPFNAIRPDQDYYIADRSLVIYFALYELAPYVYGFLYFPISVYDIQDIISDQGPLATMLVNY